MIQVYSEELFKAPKYEYYFRSFINQYDEKAGTHLASKSYKIGPATQNAFSDFYTKQQKEALKK